jgi:hypothetical protein
MTLLWKSFEAKLVPLNKVWPDIPKADQFRPIVIESSLYKFVELRFYHKLKRYLVNRLDRNQTGFVPGMGTSVNIQLLIEQLKEAKKKDKKCCLFIDYKSAYNTINKDKLYQILEERNILDPEEIQFLRELYRHLYFECKGEKFYLMNGTN